MAPTDIEPRRSVAVVLLAAGIIGVAATAYAVARAVTSDDVLPPALAALALALLLVALPLSLARAVLRTRLRVDDDAVERWRGEHRVARLRFSDVEEVRVAWQVTPGTGLGRRVAVSLLGPAEGGARGVVANGLLLADLEPLLDRVAAEVARRPQVLTSDRATYDDVMAARPHR